MNVEKPKQPWLSTYAFNKNLYWGKLRINANARRNNGAMGRFGAGWNYKLGITVGGNTWMFDLVLMSVLISWSEFNRNKGA